MFDSNRSTHEAEIGRRSGDVLTVVDEPLQRLLNAALGEVARPIHLESLSAAIAVASKVPVRAVLLGAAAIDPAMSPTVANLANACPGGVLIAVVGKWTPAMPERLLAFGGYGIRDAVDLSRREGLSRLRNLLGRAEWDLASRVAESLFPSLESATQEMRVFVSHLIRAAPSVSSIKTLAGELHVRSSSLISRFYRARLPSPKSYLAATRLVYAAGVLETPNVSVAQTARHLHYSSPQSFARHIRGQLGVSATQFRERYSFDMTASHFAYRLVIQHRDTLRWFEPLGRRVPTDVNQHSTGD